MIKEDNVLKTRNITIVIIAGILILTSIIIAVYNINNTSDENNNGLQKIKLTQILHQNRL